ncbi:MAG: DUF177 domain-containing protein [Ancalomicrobiaceae bacterium]|nr:DUF177 domain-containing protein [Ancalomicrobiaceae bacterium]
MTATEATDNDSPVSRSVILAEVPNDGRHVTIAAKQDELAALAEFADVEAVTRFAAELHIRPWSKHGFIVTGTVSADVVQTCVVTLEPVPNVVNEAIELKLVPSSEAERYAPKPDSTGEVEVNADAVDLPDFFDGPSIDVGAVAVEFFVLGLDPYPRKDGAVFDPPDDPDAASLSPFAKLLALKRES